jgi:hypothetical protein
MVALMPTIDDAAILSRAKQLCEAAGMAWDYRDRVASRGHASRNGVLDDEARRDYLMRARSQLRAESGDRSASHSWTARHASDRCDRVMP